jgi:hypothetical protein
MASDLQVTISASVKGLIDGLHEASSAVRENTSAMEERFHGLAEVVEKIKAPFAAAIAALAGGAAFKEAIHESVEYEERIAKLGRVMGVGAEEASVMHNALKRISVESQAYELAIYRVQIALRTQEAALNANGVKTRDAAGEHLGINEIMEQGIRRVQELSAGYDRNALAQLMFGRSAKELEELQRLNAQRTQEAREQVEELGIAVTESGAEAMYEYKAAMAGADTVVSALGYRIGFALIPALTQLAQDFQKIGPVIVNAIVPAFEAIGTILESTTFKLVLLAGAFKLVLAPAVLYAGKSVLAFIQTLQVQYALGVAEAAARSVQFTQALNTTSAAASQLGIVAGASLADKLRALGSIIAGMINWWVVLAAVIIGGVYAIERYISAESRAAKSRLEQADTVKVQTERFRELTEEAEKLTHVIENAKSSDAEVKLAKEKLAVVIKQLNSIYPEFNKYLVDENGNQRDIAEAIKLVNAERAKDLRFKLEAAQAELATLESLKAAEDKRAADAKRRFEAEHDARRQQVGDTQGYGAAAVAVFDWVQGKMATSKGNDVADAINKQLEAIKRLQEALETVEGPKPKPDTFVDANNTGRLSLWQKELEELKAMEENWFTWSTAREQKFWASKLAISLRNSGEYAGALRFWNVQRRKTQEDDHEAELARIKTELDDKNRADNERLALADRLIEEELRVHRKGAKEVADAERKKAEVIRQVGERHHESTLQQLKEGESLNRADGARRIEFARKAVEEEVRFHKEGSEQVAAARRKLAQVEREVDLDRLAAARSYAEGIRQVALVGVENEQANLAFLREIGELNKGQELDALRQLAAQKYAIERESNLARLNDTQLTQEQRQEIYNKDKVLYAKYMAELNQLSRQQYQESMKYVNVFIDSFASSFEQGFLKVLRGQMSISDAIKGLWSITFQALTQAVAKMVADWIAQGLKMLANWITMRATETAVDTAAGTAQKANAVSTATTVVGANAAKAGSGAAATAAEVPGVGWAMAIPVMLGVVAAVLALRTLFGSAEGGWDLPSGGPFPAVLHSKEMVLPSNIAQPLRQAIGNGQLGGEGGGGSQPVVINIHAVDAVGLDRVLQNRRSTIIRIAQEAVRNRSTFR